MSKKNKELKVEINWSKLIGTLIGLIVGAAIAIFCAIQVRS